MRNLFGWSSPPKRKDRKYSRLRAAALQDLIQAKEAHQIFVDIEEHGDGYVIPLSLLNILSNHDGTIDSMGNMQVSKTSGTSVAELSITIGSDNVGLYRIHGIHFSGKVDANVADRVCYIRVKPYQALSLTAGTKENAVAFGNLTLSASQEGHIYVTESERAYTMNDNGTVATSNFSLMTMVVIGGTKIVATISNDQAADLFAMYVIYRKVGEV